MLVRNVTKNTILAENTAQATTSKQRKTGLLQHERLPEGEGLWIAPCEAVHSFWMKFPIDVLYLNKKKKVLKIRRNMLPWRISACLSAHSVLELPAGVAEETRTAPGDQLEFQQDQRHHSNRSAGNGNTS